MKTAIIEMENGKTMTLELYPEKAPITVENFEKLASSGFYDGLIFHRVIKGFMIQGGDPTGTGMGGPGWQHSRHPDSAGSQFFIMHEDAPHLDGQYAAFGKMTDGFDCLDEIACVRTDYSDKPISEQKIKKVTVK